MDNDMNTAGEGMEEEEKKEETVPAEGDAGEEEASEIPAASV